MKKYIFTVVFFQFIWILGGMAQTTLMPNLVNSKQFLTDKEIYPTFTQGIVHYEAEIMYIYGEVYVADQMPDSSNHTLPTFRSAYLMPIYSQFKKNEGKVHPDLNDELYLFLNIEYDAKKTYMKLWEQLKPYHEMLTYRSGNDWHQGKVRIVFVGNAPMRILQQERVSFAASQGNIADLDKKTDNKVMPLIGIDFNKDLDWNGIGKMPFDQYTKFKEVIRKSHEQGKKVRVFNCPSDENVWDVLLTGGVDMISTPDIDKFSEFMKKRQ